MSDETDRSPSSRGTLRPLWLTVKLRRSQGFRTRPPVPARRLSEPVTCAVMLASMLVLTWTGGGRLGLDRPDRIALLMCGSKKSLATGLPMAAVLFSPTLAASVALPVIVFHQLQLATCAVLARRLASQVE